MEGTLIFQKMKRRLGILLGKKGDAEAGLDQRQTKQFPLARAVVDQENGGMQHHYREEYQQGLCREIMGCVACLKFLFKQIVML